MFDTFARVLPEYLLLIRKVNTPLLHMGGSAYMHSDKAECIENGKKVWLQILNEGGLKRSLSPLIVGIVGRGGLVAEGALDMIKACFDYEMVGVD